MLREIVRDSVARQSDMEIVGDFGESDEFLEAVEGVDVAIIGAREPDDSTLARKVLQASPSTRVLIIAMNGDSAVLWELRPYKVRIDDVSPESLIRAIRSEAELIVGEGPAARPLDDGGGR
jgi:DNA-binding NarL/FixJ family response regulator